MPDTLKQTKLTCKKAIKVMRRFDKNLNVTNKKIPFFHCLRDNLACVRGVPKGRKRRFWVREKHEGRARNEEGERVPLLASPSRAVSLLNSLPLPFERLPRGLEIIKLFYNHIHLPSKLIKRCDFNPRNLIGF